MFGYPEEMQYKLMDRQIRVKNVSFWSCDWSIVTHPGLVWLKLTPSPSLFLEEEDVFCSVIETSRLKRHWN